MCTAELAKLVVFISLILTAACSAAFFSLGGYFLYASGITYVNNLIVNGCFVIGAVFLLLLVLGWSALATRACFVHIVYMLGLIAIFVAEAYLCYLAFTNSTHFDGSRIWNSMTNESRQKFQDWAECCGYDDLSQAQGRCTYTTTCKERIESTIQDKLQLIKWILLCMGIFQVINMVCAGFIAGTNETDAKVAQIKDKITLLETARHVRH